MDDGEVTFAFDAPANDQVGVAVTVEVARDEAQAITARDGFRIADLFARQDERGSPLQATRAAEQDVDRPAWIGRPALFARDGDREVGVAIVVEVTCGEGRSEVVAAFGVVGQLGLGPDLVVSGRQPVRRSVQHVDGPGVPRAGVVVVWHPDGEVREAIPIEVRARER